MRLILALAGLAALVAAQEAAAAPATPVVAKETEAKTHDAGWWRKAKCMACKSKYTSKCRYRTGFKGWFASAHKSTKGKRYLVCYYAKTDFKCKMCKNTKVEEQLIDNAWRSKY